MKSMLYSLSILFWICFQFNQGDEITIARNGLEMDAAIESMNTIFDIDVFSSLSIIHFMRV